VREVAEAIPDIAMEAYGPRRSASWMFLTKDAAKADMNKLARAFELEEGGAAPEDIWTQTGWFRAPWDQQWRFEIDDSKARQSMARYPRGTTLGKYWKHPELYENHPELANVRVWPGTAEPGTGAYTADDLFGIDRISTPRQADPSITAHEVQHGVQRQSGTAFGGGQNTAWSDPQLHQAAEAETQRLWEVSVQKLADAGRLDILDSLTPEQLASIHSELKRIAGNNVYPRLAGEAEARLTQARLGMNAEQRAQSFPLAHMKEMLQAEQSGVGIEGLIPRYVSRPGDVRMQMPQLSGLIDSAEIAPPKRGWKFGDPIEGDFQAPKLIDDLMQGRPVSREALAQFEEGAKKAGNPAEWIEQGKRRLTDMGDEVSAATHQAASDSSQVHDFVDDVVVRIGVLNTPALDGERFKRVRAVMEAIERGDRSVDVPKLGSMMPGETVTIDIPPDIRGKKVREFYNVPINDPILRKPRPPDFNYPIVVTGNPHLTNFIRPDPSWDEVIKTVRVKPVFRGNEKVDGAIAKAINYAHEIDARPLVTTFRDNSLWRLSRYTSLLPTDPKDPSFATYWKKNPKPPPEDKNMRPHYNEYLPTEAAKRAFRDAGWDVASNIKEVHAKGKEWYPRSRELSDGILGKVKDKEGPIEYCDALGAGCTSCRNCAKTTQPKQSHQSPIVGCTDEPWCSNACPGCFVPRATKGNTKGRQKIALGTNVKQGGYGQADLGDTYKGTVDVLQGVMRSQQAPVNYAARFMTLDPAGQADMAVSLYTSGLIGKPEYQTMLKEIRGAAGILDKAPH
jgi:hypothetical protein